MARVFISHSSKNNELATDVLDWLKADGHDVFLDYDRQDGIEGGDLWEERLHERLRWADAVVCLVTSDYVKSKWCFSEIFAAKTLGSRIVPLAAEKDVHHPLLGGFQDIAYHDAQPQARERVCGILRELDTTGGAGWPDGRSPFPGLRAFDVDMHRAFFGRRREVGDLMRLLRSLAERGEGQIVVIVGPSGCGKSSLVRAGLLPAMANEPGWATLAPFTPGTDPIAALSQELAHAARSIPSQIRQQLGEDKDLIPTVEDLLRTRFSPPRRRLLVVIDQFEEILTRSSATGRAQLAAMLGPAAAGPVQVVVTIRSEFLDSLLADPHLAPLPIHCMTLRPLDAAMLPRVIEGPARLAGLGVDPELVSRMVTDTASGDALPLLAFTLEQLATSLPRGAALSPQRYDQLGGVQGALTRQADAALAEASATGGRGRAEVIAGLLRLVTVDEQGRPTRWQVPREELPEPVVRELDAFVRRRLLTTDTDQGRVVIGVAHEAFLSAWAPLAQAIEENASALRARRAVEQAATEWDDGGRPAARLWERGQLAAALADTGARTQSGDLITDRVDLSPTARLFLRTSIRRDRYRRGRTTTVLSVLLVLAVVAAGIALIQQRAAAHQRDVAISRQAAGQALDLRATNPALAAQLALAAYRLVPTTEARSSLLSILANPYAARLTAHTSAVTAVAFRPDGHTLATGSADQTARLWDIHDPHHPTPLATLTGHTNKVSSVAFSADGGALATASSDTTVRLWDVRDPAHPTALGTLIGHTNGVLSVVFSPDGRTLVTASFDETARLWDLPGPIVAGHTNTVVSVAFSPDGHTLATASADNTARLWDVHDPDHPTALGTLIGHTGIVYSVAFSPDGHTLATASFDDTAWLWDIHDPHHPTPLATLTGHTNTVNSVAFSPDGHTLATGSLDQTARLWDIRDPHHPTPLSTLTGHTSSVSSVAFSPDGHTLATASFDDTVLLWDIRDPHHPMLLSTLTGHTNIVYSVVFSPDGHTLATGSADDTARLWDIRDPHHPMLLSTLTGHTSSVYSVAFSPDGHTLATASADNTARLWETKVDRVAARICSITTVITKGEWDHDLPGLVYRPPCS
ncbi:MAG: TIR domain-containing protein [Pseudonocardiales bacterium]|nr:TIR domain-containing protein [Pseudonocardiales bacterium]